jgi:hypothetical protein
MVSNREFDNTVHQVLFFVLRVANRFGGITIGLGGAIAQNGVSGMPVLSQSLEPLTFQTVKLLDTILRFV